MAMRELYEEATWNTKGELFFFLFSIPTYFEELLLSQNPQSLSSQNLPIFSILIIYSEYSKYLQFWMVA
jgi:hypothetical protein